MLETVRAETQFYGLKTTDKIFVAGHRGLVGSAVLKRLQADGYTNLVTVNRTEGDLRDPGFVKWLFSAHLFDYVFFCAARVGGIKDNAAHPLEFFCDNMQMEMNVLLNAAEYGVKKLLFLGSSCIYPRNCPQPIKEDYLLTGSIEHTTEPYALAKIAGVRLCQWLRKEKGVNFISAMPCNLFGPNDNFDPETGHIIPGMMARMRIAIENNAPEFWVWGSGNQTREVLFSEDAADGLLHLMKHYDEAEPINLGSGIESTVAYLAANVAEVMGLRARINFDTNQPEGTPRKVLDISRICSIGWRPRTTFRSALYATREAYLQSRKK